MLLLEKDKNTGNDHFLLFSKYFQILTTNPTQGDTFNMSFANALDFDN